MASKNRPLVVVSIAASDSGGGAGIQADLLTFASYGVFGASVVTAVTAQNTRGISAVEPVSAKMLARQLEAVFSDLNPSAVKIGALYDGRRARIVAEALRKWRTGNVVLDPILAATTGETLLSPTALAVLRRELLPLCDLVTPNIPEAEVLAGIRIRGEKDRRLAVELIARLGTPAVLLKGGHGRGRTVTDLLFDRGRLVEYRHPRIDSRATHGTGCTLSSAVAANLALGRSMKDSVGRAIRYVEGALRRGIFPGRGRGVPGRFPTRRES